MHAEWIRPDWPAPARVHAVSTTRDGGVSTGVYASLNLGQHVGDEPAAVAENRRRLLAALGLADEPRWLEQVHGKRVARLEGEAVPEPADAAATDVSGEACVIMTADCLPVLFCDTSGTRVAAAHAGWRGLAAGVLEASVRAMDTVPGELLAWMGPAIGPKAYEVGEEVRRAFLAHDPRATAAFAPGKAPGKWWCDLYMLARQRLEAAGVQRIHGGGYCTYRERERFFSFRRDGECGRMASLIWLA
ncbi:MAG TPA: peptidoglycan editing factor PgeF [Gammaproteobacteria bacterium]|nr:peptidoglycan editing factor PgeF [Gammaproteobacteria bacterium]